MDIAALLDDLFGRVAEHVHEAVDGLDADAAGDAAGRRGEHRSAGSSGTSPGCRTTTSPTPRRGADLDDRRPWPAASASTPDPDNTGYGHTADDVATVRPDGAGRPDRVLRRRRRPDRGVPRRRVTPADLDRIVDERWDPPVTLGVRLVSIADDDIQHAGQAAYARGLLAAR